MYSISCETSCLTFRWRFNEETEPRVAPHSGQAGIVSLHSKNSIWESSWKCQFDIWCTLLRLLIVMISSIQVVCVGRVPLIFVSNPESHFNWAYFCWCDTMEMLACVKSVDTTGSDFECNSLPWNNKETFVEFSLISTSKNDSKIWDSICQIFVVINTAIHKGSWCVRSCNEQFLSLFEIEFTFTFPSSWLFQILSKSLITWC